MAQRFLGYTDESAAAADLRSYARTTGAATVNTLPMFSALGPNKIADSVYRQADAGNQVIVGLTTVVNAAQGAGNPCVVIGKNNTLWSTNGICIGINNQAGVNANRPDQIVIGFGLAPDTPNTIRIGTSNAFQATGDTIILGTQSTSSAGGVSIGRGTSCGANSVSIGFSAIAAEQWSVSIGFQASCANSGNGTGSKCIAIGYQASATVTAPGDQSAIAIGRTANAFGRNSIAIGFGANVPYGAGGNEGCIAIGYGATVVRTGELVFGDNAATKQIQLVTVRSGAAAAVRHRTGGSGEWMIRNLLDTADIFSVDESAGANNMRLLIWDVTGAVLKRVTRGAADSGGIGFRTLLIAN